MDLDSYGGAGGDDKPVWQRFNMDDSDEEFERSGEDKFTGRTALLIVIDATPPMFEGWEDNDETPFAASIKCCESIWRSKVASNPADLVSVVLVGTQKSKNSNFPNIYELQEFSTVKVAMIKELAEMKNAKDLTAFAENIGSSEKFSLKDLFWHAKMGFDKAKTEKFSRKLLYFTSEDNPHGSNANLQADVVSKFKDLGKIDFNIVSFKEDFNFELFYSKIVEDSSAVIFSRNLGKLTKIVRMKQRLKRPISRSTLEFAPGMKIGIGFYSFVRKALPPKAISINMRNNEVVERSVNVFRATTGTPILKSEERKVASVQGETAVFTAQEIKETKASQEPGVVLLGFRKMQDIDHLIWYRSPCYFLYPDEEHISGSTEIFTTMLQRCHALERIPVVKFVLTRGKTPKLGLLLPSLPEDKKSIFPQGFHIFPIPFSDEVRKHENESDLEATPELVASMEKLVKRLTNSKFDFLEIKNPHLQTMWAKLEEEALEEQVDVEENFDYTEPNEELMLAQLKSLPAEIGSQAEKIAKSFSSSKSSAPIKKPRIDIEMEARHSRLWNCSASQLREFLTSNGMEVPYFSAKKHMIGLVNKLLGL